MKCILVAAATFAAFLAPHAAQAQGGHRDTATVTVWVQSLEDEGRLVVFESGDKTIKAKISGSRTAITIDGNKAKGEKLVVGMVCKIAYDPQQEEFELKSMDCKS